MRKLIVVSKESCKPCSLLHNFLDSKEIPYEDVEYTTENIDKYKLWSVPTIILLEEDKEIDRVVGFKVDEIEVLASKLDKVEEEFSIVELLYKCLEYVEDVEVFIAKVKEEAIIPTKRDEDACYDAYACLDSQIINGEEIKQIICPMNQTTLIPTGLAMALPKTHYLNAKHERGSTAKIGMSTLAGVIDSGFRNEIFIAINPLNKPIEITSSVNEVIEYEHFIQYPYSKAIAQFSIDRVPKVKLNEISYEDLLKIKSMRGLTMLGQSGK